MSPMCMHAATASGAATDFHVVHYGARALGGAGLVMLETTAVLPNGVTCPGDLGIWDDAHLPGLRRVIDAVHLVGGRAGAQIGHSGRQLGVSEPTAVAPSPVPWSSDAWPAPSPPKPPPKLTAASRQAAPEGASS